MFTYQVLVRINSQQTINIQVQAPDDNTCKLMVEGQYGIGNCLSYTSAQF